MIDDKLGQMGHTLWCELNNIIKWNRDLSEDHGDISSFQMSPEAIEGEVSDGELTCAYWSPQYDSADELHHQCCGRSKQSFELILENILL